VVSYLLNSHLKGPTVQKPKPQPQPQSQPQLSDDTLNCMCRDAHAHSSPQLVGSGASTILVDFEAAFKAIWPYILQALEALAGSGNLTPTAAQIMAKGHELAGAGSSVPD